MSRLKEIRLSRKYLQEDVAKVLDVSRTTYVKYENGQSDPPTSAWVRLAEFYNVSVDYLVGKETHEKSRPVVELQLFADCPEKREALELLGSVPNNEMKEVLSFLRFKESQRNDK